MKSDNSVGDECVVMVVDDEPENLNVLTEMLRRTELTVMAFPNGELALEAAQWHRPDIVLLDIRMPDLDGYEVCSRLKQNDRLRLVPVIFLSAFTDISDKIKAFHMGGADYLTKPFAEAEVLARVRMQLRLRKCQMELERLINQHTHDLAETNRRLGLLDAAKSLWMAALSHEVRTPLTHILALVELMFMRMSETPELEELRAEFVRSRSQIEKLLEDTVVFSSIGESNERLQVTVIQLLPLIRRALGSVLSCVEASVCHTELRRLNHVWVKTNMTLLQQALEGLAHAYTNCSEPGTEYGLCVRLDTDFVSFRVYSLRNKRRLERKNSDTVETMTQDGLKDHYSFAGTIAWAFRIIELFNGRASLHRGSDNEVVLEFTLPCDTVTTATMVRVDQQPHGVIEPNAGCLMR